MKWQGRPQSTNIEFGRKPVVQDKSRKQRNIENKNLRNQPSNTGDGMRVPSKTGPYQPTYDQVFNGNPTSSSANLTAPSLTAKDMYN